MWGVTLSCSSWCIQVIMCCQNTAVLEKNVSQHTLPLLWLHDYHLQYYVFHLLTQAVRHESISSTFQLCYGLFISTCVFLNDTDHLYIVIFLRSCTLVALLPYWRCQGNTAGIMATWRENVWLSSRVTATFCPQHWPHTHTCTFDVVCFMKGYLLLKA